MKCSIFVILAVAIFVSFIYVVHVRYVEGFGSLNKKIAKKIAKKNSDADDSNDVEIDNTFIKKQVEDYQAEQEKKVAKLKKNVAKKQRKRQNDLVRELVKEIDAKTDDRLVSPGAKELFDELLDIDDKYKKRSSRIQSEFRKIDKIM